MGITVNQPFGLDCYQGKLTLDLMDSTVNQTLDCPNGTFLDLMGTMVNFTELNAESNAVER